MRLLVADADRRGEGAGADAVDRLEREQQVGRGAADRDVELLRERLGHQRRAGDVAGGAHAHADDVLADRREPELGVEAGDAEDARERQVRLLGDVLERDARQVAVGLLRGVQRLDEAGAGADAGDHGVEELHVDLGHEARRLLAHDAGGVGAAALTRQGEQGGGALGLDVEGQLVELGAVVDLDAVHGAGALAQRAGVALVGPGLVLDEVEEPDAARLVHELAALEVDALEDFVEGRAAGLGGRAVPSRHPCHLSPYAGSGSGARSWPASCSARPSRARRTPARCCRGRCRVRRGRR